MITLDCPACGNDTDTVLACDGCRGRGRFDEWDFVEALETLSHERVDALHDRLKGIAAELEEHRRDARETLLALHHVRRSLQARARALLEHTEADRLRAEVEHMRAVVEAAREWRTLGRATEDAQGKAVALAYGRWIEAAMAVEAALDALDAGEQTGWEPEERTGTEPALAPLGICQDSAWWDATERAIIVEAGACWTPDHGAWVPRREFQRVVGGDLRKGAHILPREEPSDG